ncbi:tetraacyldisaccharide 4'-kinase [Castellaniella defragrans]|jgi:tetraacyldisaccharide 4'-kinase|uniref:Tetraacyldisaccharide 4'-kinase n=1 Tax=Castellaniella defragrans (strain DSM 12143 / CCUG 39792 / 65Phen) TaxID=1437824 RepID=W8WYV2_CASD6|nr:tetraacyldisaccharide 4'-kinase [Castellaniella defragrans]CDM24759.1 Tetraacyldisaccharide 4'-kinase [Castellaniella defragrans 65Phen]
MNRRLEDFMLAAWSRRGGLSTLLLPLSRLYGLLSARRLRAGARAAWRAPVPVVVVGNILVGGTGKTPVTIAVCQALQARGWRPGIVSRGYGAAVGPRPRLSDEGAAAARLGDEPALIHAATGAPVAVHPRRALAAAALLAAHPDVDVLIADDGLQHTALARDLEIIVQDGRGTGNGRLLPAGPLREPPERLARADWLVTHLAAGEPAPPAASAVPALLNSRASPASPAGAARAPRAVVMRLEPEGATHLASGRDLPWDAWRAEQGAAPCSAAAGIGRPERFFAMLRAAGVVLARTLRVPDHQAIPAEALRGLPPGPILITPKDAVKCAAPHDPRLWAVRAAPAFSDPGWLDALDQALRAVAARAGAGGE